MNAPLPMTVLPDISTARFPVVYERAKTALAECSRIDECMDWANKAEALASYAKQAQDDSMRKLADRIQARAIRRCGELLKQIDGRGKKEGALLSRTEAADEAGLSEHQRKTAIRVAAIEQQAFDEQVESNDPPTVTQLAEQGKKSRLVDLGSIAPLDYARATEAIGTVRRFAEYCTKNDAERIAAAIQPHEVADLRQHISIIDGWLDRFVVNLGN